MTRVTMITVVLALTVAATSAAGEVAGVLYGRCGPEAAPHALPLEQTTVTIDVTGGVARTEVVQQFR